MASTHRLLALTAIGAAVALAIACSEDGVPSVFVPEVDSGVPPASTNDSGDGTSSSGGFIVDDGGAGDASEDALPLGTLEAVIRDFKKYDPDASTTNADFENIPPPADDPPDAQPGYYGPWIEATPDYYADTTFAINIVLPDLGTDGKPVYNAAASWKGTPGRTATTHGKAGFDQWYHDSPGVNIATTVPIVLTLNDAGVYSYDSAESGIPEYDGGAKGYFPIDDGTPYQTAFGNQGDSHNYSFTVELHTEFVYKGNETFKFSGDDDVFVFINKKLVINIGGIHDIRSKEVSLPGVASAIGLVVGNKYPLDFFQAERHVTQSNLRIDTTIDLKAAPTTPH